MPMNKIEKMIKELCPNGVEWKKLGEVFEMRNGYTPSKADPNFWTNGDIPWFRMEDIRERGRILSDSFLHITSEAIKGKGLFKANSFILSTTATIGE
ncbi:MAG: restriction endonuclease subunit S, partial [Bacteroidales bacterium]|nr:restriction endonuclease subunit S [Bacteroidales bacterium]